MFDDVAKSLLMWALIGTVVIMTMKYVVTTFVLPGMNVTDSLYNTDKYEAYISENVTKQ